MNRPRKAIVLAAGFGARLLPLTLLKPKPLFPLWGTPALGHTLDLLRRWGVRDVLVNTHHEAGQILEYLRTHPVPGLRVEVSFEPEILGTGGVLPRARWFLDEHPFWMLNADVIADLAPRPMIEAFRSHEAIASLWLHPARGPRTVEHRDGLITVFKSPLAGTEGTATFCGLQLLSPRILRFLPPSGFASIIDAYECAMAAGERIAAVPLPRSYWADIGSHAAYLATHWEMAAHPRWRALAGQQGRKRVALGRNAVVAPGADLRQSVLWDDVRVGPHARVENAIVTDGVRINAPVPYMALRAGDLPDPMLRRVIATLGWPLADTLVLPLAPRGSARTFTRLIAPRRRAIVVRYSLERPENAFYTGHARFLARQGVSVPAVLADFGDEHVCVLEDAGDTSLESLATAATLPRLMQRYSAAISQVARLHGAATQAARREGLAMAPAFDTALYRWEHDLFCDCFLKRHVAAGERLLARVREELAALSRPLHKAPQVVVHRDLQSSNILVRKDGIILIDFQGMRLGPAAYDLASLLCDPYVELPAAPRERLLEAYVDEAPEGEAARDLFWLAAVQRLCQALGAYGRLGAIPATSYFMKHIPAGVRRLREALAHVQGVDALRESLGAWDPQGPARERPAP